MLTIDADRMIQEHVYVQSLVDCNFTISATIPLSLDIVRATVHVQYFLVHSSDYNLTGICVAFFAGWGEGGSYRLFLFFYRCYIHSQSPSRRRLFPE